MFARTLLAAIVAGLIAGALMTVVQQVKLVPLIRVAETFESSASDGHAPTDGVAVQRSAPPPDSQGLADAHASSPGRDGHGADRGSAHDTVWAGLLRGIGSLTANLVFGAGYGLLVVGCSLLAGAQLTACNGIYWGACGWLAVQFLPSLGLPPEMPGFPAADLAARQMWWTATVLASAIGLGLICLRREPAARVVGLIAIAAPQIFGAPAPSSIESLMPAYLAAQFSVATLATTLLFWLSLGFLLGLFMDRVAHGHAGEPGMSRP